MKGRVAAVWLSWVMVFSCVVLIVEIAEPVRGAITITVDDSGGADYLTIHEGIDAASDGDTVFVYNGIYNENFMVNKAINLIAESKDETIINSSWGVEGIKITTDWVNITGFTIITNYEDRTAVYLNYVNNCTITNNNVIFCNGHGIHVRNSNSNLISNNNVSNNIGYGIYITDSNSNMILNNTVLNNSGSGISLHRSNFTTIDNNNVSENYGGGIILYVADNENIISNNEIFLNRETGISLNSYGNSVINNTIYENNRGIYLSGCTSTTVIGNTMIDDDLRISCSLEGWTSHNIDNTNTVNGRKIYYWTNINGGDIPENAGQILLGNCSNIVIANQEIHDLLIGIHIVYSSHIDIFDNNISLNSNGITIYNSTNFNISNNVLNGNNYGISFDDSKDIFINQNMITNSDSKGITFGQSQRINISNNIIKYSDWRGISILASDDNIVMNNSIISGRGNGIYLSGSDNNTILDNTISDFDRSGLHIGYSQYNHISGNSISSNEQEGILLDHSNENDIYYNNVAGNQWNGIGLESSDTNHVMGNTASGNRPHGFAFYYSKGNTINENEVTSSFMGGIYLYSSEESNVFNNSCRRADDGIGLFLSKNNSITDNTVKSNDYGINLHSSENNIITNNDAFKNDYDGIRISEIGRNYIFENNISSNDRSGIHLDSSNGSQIWDNTLLNNGIAITGTSIEDWNMHEISTTNFLNGKPVYYWKNQTGGTIPMGAGQVILANCTNVNVRDQVLNNGSMGIILGFSSINNVSNNEMSNNTYYGIYLWQSDENQIGRNNASFNKRYGIYADFSHNNIISENKFNYNRDGIRLVYSNDSLVIDNEIKENYYGFYIQSSSNNRIYHNIIINNYYQVYDDQVYDYWDNGYPTGGNYWGDYNGNDDFSGPNQNEPGSDGVGDEPYSVALDMIDRYPLIIDFAPPSIILNSPDNNSVIRSGTIIDFSIFDTYLDEVWFMKDEGIYQSLIHPFDIDTSYWLDGNHSVTIKAEDLSSNEIVIQYWFTIDSEPPIINLNIPGNNSIFSAGNMINFSVTDSHLNEVLSSVNAGSYEIFSSPYHLDTSSWVDGNYKISIRVSDFALNYKEEWFEFTIDSTIPQIILSSPNNNSYIGSNVDIKLNIFDENLNNVHYSRNMGPSKSLTGPYDINSESWQDGEHTILIYTDDLAGNSNERWFRFTKDSVRPDIILNSPLNESLLLEESTINFEVSDENLESVYYSIDKGSFLSLEEPYDISTLNWDGGSHIITIKTEDKTGNTNEKWYIFSYDIYPPSIEPSSIEDNSVGIDTNAVMEIEFSEPMNTQSVEDSFSISPSVDHSFSWSNNNKTLTITCDESMEYDTLYKISIGTTAKDLADRGMEEKFELEFTTEAKPKGAEEEAFPVLYLILGLLIITIIVALILFMVMSKRKKISVSDVEPEVIEEVSQAPQTIQFTCSNCNNLLQALDNGATQNVTCPYCSTNLPVPSQVASNTLQSSYPEQSQIQPQPQTQTAVHHPQIQSPTIQISCPKCQHKFSVLKSQGPIQVQCPNCGVQGTLQ